VGDVPLQPRRRARRVWNYWRSERRTLRQGLVALFVSTGAALVAGIALGAIGDTLVDFPGLYVLIPAAVGLRGAISGTMGARLGTAVAAGVFEVSARRSGALYQNVATAVVLTFSSSLYLAVLARLAAGAFGLRSISFFDLVTIAVVGGGLGSALIITATVGLSVASFRRGWDLDTVSTPIVTAAGDMVTVPMIFLATFLVRVEWLDEILAVSAIAACLFVTVRGALTDLPQVRRALLEMTGVILLTPILDILAGTVIEPRIGRLNDYRALLVVIPPLVSTVGAMGGILASRLSSKLHLGVIEPRAAPQGLAFLDATLVAAAGLVAFAFVGVFGFVYGSFVGINPGAFVMIGGTLLTGVLATALAIVLSYYVAIMTFRFGLDPDNHSIPIITSTMDLVGVLCFLLVLAVLGGPFHG
jgi:mgtE-like transporter